MFKKIKQGRMYEEIVNQVLEGIQRGDLKPKDKLPSEMELGRLFGVSRITVREAILALEQQGVIEVRQGSTGGAYIREVDLDDVVERVGQVLRMTQITFPHLAEARSSLEGIILKDLIPSKITKARFAALEDNIQKAETHYRKGENIERMKTNFAFHVLLAEMTGNPIVILMHKLIVDLSLSFFEKIQPSNRMIEKTIAEHGEVVRLLKAGKNEEAGDLCRSHIRKVSQQIIDKSRKQALLKKIK
jgi:DNA-binding FadR family transcriptional regulator